MCRLLDPCWRSMVLISEADDLRGGQGSEADPLSRMDRAAGQAQPATCRVSNLAEVGVVVTLFEVELGGPALV